jgi:hypothetical protein
MRRGDHYEIRYIPGLAENSGEQGIVAPVFGKLFYQNPTNRRVVIFRLNFSNGVPCRISFGLIPAAH